MLELRARVTVPSIAAEVLYDAPDPFSRKVVIDRGQTQGVMAGSPVIIEAGVIGQVTRVYPLHAEVTLVTDREAAVPVLNPRTQQRSAAFGGAGGGTGLELRFVAGDADVQVGDKLTTSGLDGIYPAGLPVATVTRVERRTDAGFAQIDLAPAAPPDGVRHLLVLQPANAADAAAARTGAGATCRPPSRRKRGRASDHARHARSGLVMMPRAHGELLLPVNPLFILMSLLVALALNLVPLGRNPAMPDFLALVLVFWNVHQPLRVGIGVAFLFGLAMDVHEGALLGQHALAYTLLSFSAIAIHRRLLWFTLPSQAVQILPLFVAAHAVSLIVRLIAGGLFPGWELLLAPFIEALLWPVATVLLLAPQRRPPDPDENRPI